MERLVKVNNLRDADKCSFPTGKLGRNAMDRQGSDRSITRSTTLLSSLILMEITSSVSISTHRLLRCRVICRACFDKSPLLVRLMGTGGVELNLKRHGVGSLPNVSLGLCWCRGMFATHGGRKEKASHISRKSSNLPTAGSRHVIVSSSRHWLTEDH